MKKKEKTNWIHIAILFLLIGFIIGGLFETIHIQYFYNHKFMMREDCENTEEVLDSYISYVNCIHHSDFKSESFSLDSCLGDS